MKITLVWILLPLALVGCATTEQKKSETRHLVQGTAVSGIIDQVYTKYERKFLERFLVSGELLNYVTPPPSVSAVIAAISEASIRSNTPLAIVSVGETVVEKSTAEVLVSCSVGPEEAYVFRVKLRRHDGKWKIESVVLEASA